MSVVPTPTRPTGSLGRVLALAALCALPIVLYAVMLQYFWDRGELGIDFTQTLLPAAEEIVRGDSPYPAYGYPPLVAFALVPFTFLPSPEVVYTVLLLLGIAASLRVLGIRDWRCYGAAFLWGASFHAVQTGNVSVWLLLLTAVAWRVRESTWSTAVASGLATATKIICWPLVVWHAATGRWRAAALSVAVAGGVTAALWGSLGFSGLLDYPSSLDKLETAQAPSSYTVRALLEDAGLPTLGRLVWIGLVVLVLACCVVAGRRGLDSRSFAFAVLAAVIASPIVWLHSFVLLLAPVAVLRPRFGVVWLLPALLWLGSGTGNGATWQTVMVLVVMMITFLLTIGGETRLRGRLRLRRSVALPVGRDSVAQ